MFPGVLHGLSLWNPYEFNSPTTIFKSCDPFIFCPNFLKLSALLSPSEFLKLPIYFSYSILWNMLLHML